MNSLVLANAFGAGMLAALNPCAFAMLPSFIAFYLGAKEPGYREMPVARKLMQVLGVSGLVTTGFLTVFVLGGFLLSTGLSILLDWLPYLMIPVALALILLGVALLFGRSIQLPIMQPRWVVRRRGVLPMYLYGVGYALASTACTLPVFVAVVGGAATLGGPASALVIFIAYGLGMGAVLLAATVSAALFHGVIARWLRLLMPYVRTASSVLLIVAGLYLLGYMLYFLFGVGRSMPMSMGGQSREREFAHNHSHQLHIHEKISSQLRI